MVHSFKIISEPGRSRSHFLSVSFETSRSCSMPVVPAMPFLVATETEPVETVFGFGMAGKRGAHLSQGLVLQPLHRAIAFQVEEPLDLAANEEGADGVKDDIGQSAGEGDEDGQGDPRVVADPVTERMCSYRE